MNASDKCRVGDCDRWAAASVMRDDLPGPLRLCATHTENFRLSNVGWKINWEREAPEPTLVVARATASVRLDEPPGVTTPAQPTEHEQASGHPAWKSLAQLPSRTLQRIRAGVAARRKSST
jgi:hypothetical protein